MADRKPTVAITGANGFLGSALVDHFTSKGWHVVALIRQPITGKIKKNVSYAPYDLAKPVDAASLKDVDFLVHTAYVKQDKQHPDAFNENIQAAERLVQAARKNKVKRSVFISSMSAHDEAVSSYGKQKLAIEKIFNQKSEVSIRCGLMIGNGGILKQMVDFMRSKHAVPLVGGGNQPLQIVAMDDLVNVVDKLLNNKLSGVYTVATPQVYSYREFYKAISQQLHIKVLFVPVPFFVLINGLRLLSLLPLPIAVNPDNALGLKYLRSTETKDDLKAIGVQLHSLKEAIQMADL